jgi:outer membrane protein OmpA-like peptidoglycan-associated protein
MVSPLKNPLRAALFVAAGVYASATFADYTTYVSSLEGSNWHTRVDKSSCELVHDIPRFGRARFRQESGGTLKFMLDVDQGPVNPGALTVRSAPPAWKHDHAARELGEFKFSRGQSPVVFDRELALRLYYELENGMFPVFSSADWSDGRDTMNVAVSAVRFREAGQAFQACVAGLIHLDFDVASENRVYFATGSHALTLHGKRALEQVVKSAKSRVTPPRIVIGGHADERGEAGYNEQLSLRRARAVRQYLVKRGIAPKSIEIRYFGESWPSNPDSTNTAWAENRRATIWVAR